MKQNFLRSLVIITTWLFLFLGCKKDKTPTQERHQAPPNFSPVVNAGPNQTINFPATMANLSGSASDVDGTIVSYKWIKARGPQSFTIVSPNSPATEVKDLWHGEYEFQLIATDDKGAVGGSYLLLTVIDPNDPCAGCWDY